jgi:hypothetical protein
MMTPSLPLRPLALIYDRHPAHESPSVLTARTDRCRARAEVLGWDVAGLWVDAGMDADLPPEDRPALTRLLELMRHHDARRRVLCLVATEDRLGATVATVAAVRRLVAYAGGTTETAGGTVVRSGLYHVIERA